MSRAVAAAAAKNSNRSKPKTPDVAGREAQREITRAMHSQERKSSLVIDLGSKVGEENDESGNAVTLKSPRRRSIWSSLIHPHKESLNAKERMALQKSLEERGEYTQKEINALKKVQYRIRCRRQKTRCHIGNSFHLQLPVDRTASVDVTGARRMIFACLHAAAP